ncbi:putative holin-like toxin [Aureibacillus halotolerans]
MPVEVKDALTLMISFGAFVVALVTLVVVIVASFNQKK